MKIQIPPHVDRVHVAPLARYKNRPGVVEMHGSESGESILRRGARNGAYMDMVETSAANASRVLKAAGFFKVGRRSPFTGGYDWHKMTPEEYAALPGLESPRELRRRWSGNPRDVDERDELAIERAFDRLARAAREMQKFNAKRAELFDMKKGIDPTFAKLHDAAAAKYQKALDSLSRARKKFVDKYGDAEAYSRGYYASAAGAWRNARTNPPPPVWFDRYIAAIEAATAEARNLAAKAYDDPAKYAPQFENVDRDFHEIRHLAELGQRRIQRDAEKLGAKKNPKRPKKNPAPIPKLALLGEAIEVETSANGKRQIIRPAGAVLLVSADAKTIVIARPKSTTPTNAPAGSAGARRMFEKWSRFKSDRAVRLVIGDKPLSHKLGNVEAIRYRSDKWTGRPTLYEHKFEKPATAIADSPRSPSVIRIDGEPRRVLVTERGIVG